MNILNIICNEHKANLRELHVTSDNGMFVCNLELVVFKQKVVSQICMKLRAIPSINAVDVVAMN